MMVMFDNRSKSLELQFYCCEIITEMGRDVQINLVRMRWKTSIQFLMGRDLSMKPLFGIGVDWVMPLYEQLFLTTPINLLPLMNCA